MNNKTHYIFRDKITDFLVVGNSISIYVVNSEDMIREIKARNSMVLEAIIEDLTRGDSRVIKYDFPEELCEERDACKKEEIKEEIKMTRAELKKGEKYCSYCDINVIREDDSMCDDCLPF